MLPSNHTHARTFRIAGSLSPFDVLAVLVAALCHDLQHPGMGY